MKRFLIILTISLVSLSGAELAARVYQAQHPFIWHYPDNLSRLQEGSKHLTWTLTEGGSVVYEDLHSELFNVDDHARRTVSVPTTWQHTLWLFGNSTLMDFYAADDATMASELQALFNRYNGGWRVVNLAVESYGVAQEYRRLKDTPIRIGDVVIFIDGAPDAERAYYYCDPRRTRFEPFALATAVCDWLNRTFQADIRPAISEYERAIERARQWSTAHGAAFLHVFQADNPQTDSHAAIARFYRALHDEPLRLRAPQTTFVDNIHLLPEANPLVAKVIFDKLNLF